MLVVCGFGWMSLHVDHALSCQQPSEVYGSEGASSLLVYYLALKGLSGETTWLSNLSNQPQISLPSHMNSHSRTTQGPNSSIKSTISPNYSDTNETLLLYYVALNSSIHLRLLNLQGHLYMKTKCKGPRLTRKL